MVLDVSPDSFSEQRTANWSPYDIVHSPVQILGYSGTTSRTISISAKLVSRLATEAKINKNRIQVIRHWVVNDFGVGNTGSPPPILRLKAFKNTFPEMQGYLTSYSVEYPSDVDWITTTEGDPFPTVMTVSMSFIETYSPAQMRSFNRYNLKGATYSAETIGRGGSGIGEIGAGLSGVIDMNAYDGIGNTNKTVTSSADVEVNTGIAQSNGDSAFAESVRQAKDTNKSVLSSVFSTSQSQIMSNNFSSLPSTDYVSEAIDSYSMPTKSLLTTTVAKNSFGTASTVNTKYEDISLLCSKQ